MSRSIISSCLVCLKRYFFVENLENKVDQKVGEDNEAHEHVVLVHVIESTDQCVAHDIEDQISARNIVHFHVSVLIEFVDQDAEDESDIHDIDSERCCSA